MCLDSLERYFKERPNGRCQALLSNGVDSYEEEAVDTTVLTGSVPGSSSHFLTIDRIPSILRLMRYILLHMKIRISTKKKKLTIHSERTMSIQTLTCLRADKLLESGIIYAFRVTNSDTITNPQGG